MVKRADAKEREKEILNLVVESYIRESKPISSSYLCDKYRLPYSSATVRNVLETLEEKGFLSHLHTSSGRVPTQKGFKHYVSSLKNIQVIKSLPVALNTHIASMQNVAQAANVALDSLAQMSGYASLIALSNATSKLFLRRTRLILEQPEFDDIHRLKNLFFALEEKIDQLQDMLLHHLNESVEILVGDEIGFVEMNDCSLIVSGTIERDFSVALALLGPMRMDYTKASSCLYTIKNKLKKTISDQV
jgi:transcriptional regulator of heat shock response